MLEKREVVVQIGPHTDIKSLIEDPISYYLLNTEAGMIVKALVSYGLVVKDEECTVCFRNDDLGNEISYPFVSIGEKIYKLTLPNYN